MKPYNDYNSYLKKKYGCRVQRIGIDAGFSCPNRDGTKGTGGCIYCNEDGSRALYADQRQTARQQLARRIEYLAKKRGTMKYIAYFQAFTNTYAPLEKLKAIYDSIRSFKDIVGITIGTRPDEVDRQRLDLIATYADRYEVWLELGLQSIDDAMLSWLGRGHTVADFVRAVTLAHEYGIRVSAHLILGLPGETDRSIRATAELLNDLKIDGIKIHVLHILKGSVLEKLYRAGKVTVLTEDEYVRRVVGLLEHLSEDIVIQRLTGEGPRSTHIAPAWALHKVGTIKKIEALMAERKSSQGSAISSSRP